MKKIVCILTMVLSLGVSGCAGVGHRYFNTADLNLIDKDIDRFKGRLVAFKGRVIDAKIVDEISVFQIMTITGGYRNDWYNGELLTVIMRRKDIPAIKNSEITVLGFIIDPIEGQNAFGVNISSVAMRAIAIYHNYKTWRYGNKKELEYGRQWMKGEVSIEELSKITVEK